MTTRKPKSTPAQHAAQAPIRKARRAANQQRADARLDAILEKFAPLSFCRIVWDEKTPYHGAVEEHRFVREYPFHPGRKWKFDCAFIDEKIAIEIDGGQWQVTGRDQTREAERHNAATLAGWLVLHMTSEMIDDDLRGCAELLRQAFAMREIEPDGKPSKVRDVAERLAKQFFDAGAYGGQQQTPISGSAMREIEPSPAISDRAQKWINRGLQIKSLNEKATS